MVYAMTIASTLVVKMNWIYHFYVKELESNVLILKEKDCVYWYLVDFQWELFIEARKLIIGNKLFATFELLAFIALRVVGFYAQIIFFTLIYIIEDICCMQDQENIEFQLLL